MSRDLNSSSGFILIRDPNGGPEKKIPLNEVVVNETQAAEILDQAIQTVRNNRHLRKGPAYLKLGSSVRYRVKDLFDYMERHRIDPEA